jgi:hypothetical protein
MTAASYICGNISVFPYILGSPSSYITATASLWISLYTVWEKFDFIFYQCINNFHFTHKFIGWFSLITPINVISLDQLPEFRGTCMTPALETPGMKTMVIFCLIAVSWLSDWYTEMATEPLFQRFTMKNNWLEFFFK